MNKIFTYLEIHENFRHISPLLEDYKHDLDIYYTEDLEIEN